MTGRVFITHEPMRKNPVTHEYERVRDVSSAKVYGDIVHVFPAGRLVQEPEYIMRCAREKMASFTDEDFLLLSGDTLAIAACCWVAAQQIGGERIKVLLWDNRVKHYNLISIAAWQPDDDWANQQET